MQSRDGDPTTAILGDSHSLSLFYGLAEFSKQNPKINIVNLRRDASYLMKNVGTSGKSTKYLIKKELDETTAIANHAYEIVANTPSINTVIIVLRGSTYLDQGIKKLSLKNHPELIDNKLIWQAGLEETLSYLLNEKKHVIVVLDWPQLTFDPKRCLANQLCGLSRHFYEDQNHTFKNLAYSILKKSPSVIVFDAASYLCDKATCHAMINNEIMYKDEDHLSTQGSLFLGKFLIPILEKFY